MRVFYNGSQRRGRRGAGAFCHRAIDGCAVGGCILHSVLSMGNGSD